METTIPTPKASGMSTPQVNELGEASARATVAG
jgi:hypothetical protein